MSIRKGRLTSVSLSAAPVNFPTGSVLDFAGGTAPAGWLLCYGQAVSRTEYAGLFATLGETYGSGDGSTTFNLPDYRGRVLVGKDNMGGSAAGRMTSVGLSVGDGNTLGSNGGAQVHTLSSEQLPSHSHNSTQDTHNHTFSGLVTTADASSSPANYLVANDTSSESSSFDVSYIANDTHRHTINDSAQTGQTAQTRGQSHTNTQPSIIANKIIKV